MEIEGSYAAKYKDLPGQRLEGSSNSTNVPSGPLLHVGDRQVYFQYVQMRHHSSSSLIEGSRWMRISGTWSGPLAVTCLRHPFLQGGVRFKSRSKIKRAKAKKREILQKIKRIRVVAKKRLDDMTYEEKLAFKLEKTHKKVELIKAALAKMPKQEIPPEDPDFEVMTAEQLRYLKKIGHKNRNYVPVGKRGIFGGTIENMHMHWKKHETVQVEFAGFNEEEVKAMAVDLARLSGGLVVDIYLKKIVIVYRGRNYEMPKKLIPIKTLDKRKALTKALLEQSMRALIHNGKKVEMEIAELQKENEQRQSGELLKVEGQGGSIDKQSNCYPSFKLEGPEKYSEASISDNDTVGDDVPVCELYDEVGVQVDDDPVCEFYDEVGVQKVDGLQGSSLVKLPGSDSDSDWEPSYNEEYKAVGEDNDSDEEGFCFTELLSSDSDSEDCKPPVAHYKAVGKDNDLHSDEEGFCFTELLSSGSDSEDCKPAVIRPR